MTKKLFYSLMSSWHFAQAIRRLRQLEKKLVSPKARFAIPFAFQGKGFFKTMEPRQSPLEIEELYHLVCKLAPERVLEVGTARGGTLYLWTQAAAPGATLVSVDLPKGEFGGAYPEKKIPFYQAFARPNQKLHLMRKDSHDPRTVSEVREVFDGNMIDFAFIDGDHTYEGVKADFLNFGPLVRPGGLIAFHDILPRPDMPSIQVDRFWQEIKKEYRTRDVVNPGESGRKIGIGLVYVEGAKTSDASQFRPPVPNSSVE